MCTNGRNFFISVIHCEYSWIIQEYELIFIFTRKDLRLIEVNLPIWEFVGWT